MSDLIDLASPDNEKVLGPKLSSPLIPLPKNKSMGSPESTQAINLQYQRITDNPFDMELQKINEFMSKSEDPFEVIWQKANNAHDVELHNANKNQTVLTDIKDDLHYKKTKNFDILKMNRTLDDSLIGVNSGLASESKQNNSILNAESVSTTNINQYQINNIFGNIKWSEEYKNTKSRENLPLLSLNPPSPDFNNLSILNQSVMNDSFSLDLLPVNTMNSSNYKEKINQFNSSILNQSAMNDSLSGSNSSDNGLIKSIVARRIANCIQKGIQDAETDINIPNEKYHKLRRSYSQGDQLSIENIKQICSRSNIDSLKVNRFNDYSMPSAMYEDPFNQGFITMTSSDNTISDISAISSLRRINSVASGVSSNDTESIKNLGFIEESSLSSQDISKNPQSCNINPHLSSSSSSLAEISDLVAQYDRLKAKISHNSTNTSCLLINLDKENSVQQNENQMIDVTSDSVFHDFNSPPQQILSEEILMKQPVNKSNLKSHCGSDSSGDDTLPKRPPSVMELLPDIELSPSDNNQAVVDNLIELQTSNSDNDQVHTIDKNTLHTMEINKDNDDTKIKDMINLFEEKLFAYDKKLTVTTLLIELEKIVNKDKNSKAVEILENLKRVLGVKCSNNVELLEMYVQDIDSAKDADHIEESNELKFVNSNIHNVNISTDENTNIDCNDSLKHLGFGNFDTDSNNTDTEKTMNKDEQLQEVSDFNAVTPEKSMNDNLICETEQSQSLSSPEKLVVDIQIALQKLLISNNCDPMAFIDNLNKVFNPSVNKVEVKETKINEINNSPVRRISTSPLKKIDSSSVIKKSSSMRRSVGSLSSLKKPLGLQRHSSVSQISHTTTEHNTKAKTRIDSPKKTLLRRSPSDLDFNDDTKSIKKMPSNPIKLKASVSLENRNKLRKNIVPDLPVKKGPLKAFVPLSNMQRRKSFGKKIPPLIIPPQIDCDLPSTFIGSTSTPNPDISINMDCRKNSSKRNPVASSTPDISNKTSRLKAPIPQSPKHNMSWNISPVTPNAAKTFTPNNSFIRNDSMKRLPQMNKNSISSPKSKGRSFSIRSQRTPESPKKILLTRDQLLSQSDSKIKRGRHSEPVKNTLSAMSELFQRKQTNTNPLKENNTPGKKIKQINLISKFQRHSNSVKVVEKENKWK